VAIPNPPLIPVGLVGVVVAGLVGLGLVVLAGLAVLAGLVLAGLMPRLIPVGLAGLVLVLVLVLAVLVVLVVLAGLMGRCPSFTLFSHINRTQTIHVPAEAVKNSKTAVGIIESPMYFLWMLAEAGPGALPSGYPGHYIKPGKKRDNFFNGFCVYKEIQIFRISLQ